MVRKKKTDPTAKQTDPTENLTEEESSAIFDMRCAAIINSKAFVQQYGQMLKRLREAKGFSVRDVEADTSISASYLYQIERGTHNIPSINVIYALARFYEIPYESLVAAAKFMGKEDVLLYNDELGKAFHYVCQDKRFKFGSLVDEAVAPNDVKRLTVEMYQHFTGVKLIEKVDEKASVRARAARKLQGKELEQGYPAERAPELNTPWPNHKSFRSNKDS